MVLANDETNGDSLGSGVDFLPTAAVSFSTGQVVTGYAKGGKKKKRYVRISPVKTLYSQRAPTIPAFSSRGPIDFPQRPLLSGRRNDLLKPDITAPGVAIWGAFAPSSTADPRRLSYNLLDGTSFATPHIAGIAAVLKQAHPTWSFYALKSALQTTASVLDNKGFPIGSSADLKSKSGLTAFDFGAGQVDASAASDPGLVYDETTENVAAWLKSIDYNQANQVLSPLPSHFVSSYNLNMPTIAVSWLSGSVVVTRRVTNVASTKSTYHATVVAPKGIGMVVSPTSFTISPGQTVTFTVKFSVSSSAKVGSFLFGGLLWSDGVHNVRSQVAVQPVAGR
eukprot:TRINITY_DN16942_c0_g2_i1.p1 TRINITY_DN16942_c0_g2~~TRINITY_DN16942_c0_g2_i1.p1  ORF type:complete len:384 (-),score=59.27 TRINITY_DN16942_c0_g2_i1:1000-2010(-)